MNARSGSSWAVAALSLLLLEQRLYSEAIVHLNNYDAKVPIYLMWSQDSKAPNLCYEVLGGPVGSALTPLVPLRGTNSVFSSASTFSHFGYFDAGFALVP